MTPDILNKQIIDLIEELKSGVICQEEAIIKFEIILKELSVILGNKHTLLLSLKHSFQIKLNYIKKINLIKEELISTEKDIMVLRAEFNLI